MEFTFGIITSGTNDHYLNQIVQSIYSQNIPKYEIIIVGKTSISGNHIRIIDFDESIKSGWITKKKNIIIQEAKYENVVLMHDYIKLNDDWYSGFIKYGNDFEICITKIYTINNRRFRDYTFWPAELPAPFCDSALLPYDYKPNIHINKLLYISGSYFIIKKHIAIRYPLNENLCWGMGEDVELCQRLTDNGILIQCNSNSSVQILKEKCQCDWEIEISKEGIALLESISEEYINMYISKQREHLKSYISTFNI